jgi:hypothetical protein
VRELGGNYPAYHEHLRAEGEKIGRPRPENFGTYEEFLNAWGRVQTILLAEVFLRNCAARMTSRWPLDSPFDPSVALVDRQDRLVGWVTGAGGL